MSKKETQEPPLTAKEELGEFSKTALIAIALAVIIRGFLFEPFNIPSGSMYPTLEVGDYIFTNKKAYGYGQYSFSLFFNLHVPVPYEGRVLSKKPERGDVVVFWMPLLKQNYIKRVIGLPGDQIQVREGRLYINDVIVERDAVGLRQFYDSQRDKLITVTEYIETLPGGILHQIYEESDEEALDNTPVFVVPEGHYFMMGDNRDHSQDSRVKHVVGFVPFENIVGRADFIFFSTNGSAGVFEFWKWPKTIRYNRLLMNIDPIRPENKKEAE